MNFSLGYNATNGKVQRLDIVANSSSLKTGSERCASFINANASLAAKTKFVSHSPYTQDYLLSNLSVHHALRKRVEHFF